MVVSHSSTKLREKNCVDYFLATNLFHSIKFSPTIFVMELGTQHRGEDCTRHLQKTNCYSMWSFSSFSTTLCYTANALYLEPKGIPKYIEKKQLCYPKWYTSCCKRSTSLSQYATSTSLRLHQKPMDPFMMRQLIFVGPQKTTHHEHIKYLTSYKIVLASNSELLDLPTCQAPAFYWILPLLKWIERWNVQFAKTTLRNEESC